MEEIKVGEYVRTKIGFIGKIVNENNDAFLLDKRIRPYESTIRDFCIFKDNIGFYEITKHSPNIIDLIEVGDYVNGSRVVDIMEDMQTGELHLEMTYNYTNEEKGDCTIYNKDIKSIVTKEQFENIKYRLED